jgi:hypothetical protein
VVCNLGQVVLSHLLSFYAGRLSRLMAGAYDWHERRARGARVDGDFLTAFVAAHLGDDHYTVSLVRYMMTAARLAGRPGGADGLRWTGTDAKTTAVTEAGSFRMSPQAAVLRDLHQGPAIVQFLTKHGNDPGVEVPAELQHVRADRVLVYRRAPDAASECIEVFTINELSRRLIESFTQPRPWPEAVRLLGTLPSVGDAALPSLLDALLERGVLCPA